MTSDPQVAAFIKGYFNVTSFLDNPPFTHFLFFIFPSFVSKHYYYYVVVLYRAYSHSLLGMWWGRKYNMPSFIQIKKCEEAERLFTAKAHESVMPSIFEKQSTYIPCSRQNVNNALHLQTSKPKCACNKGKGKRKSRRPG